MTASGIFTRWAELYDRVYAHRGKDYAREAAYLLDVIRSHGLADGRAPRSALDVACGTGGHLVHLQHHFDVSGADRNAAMLAVAQRKLPGITLHEQDMAALNLGRSYDVVLCLFGSVGYLGTQAALRDAVHAMAGHVRPGGLLLIEPPLLPERMKPPQSHVMRIDEPGLRLTRRTSAQARGDTLVISFEFNVEVPGHVGSFHERHVVRLFTRKEYERTMREAMLSVRFDPIGPAGHGLFIASRVRKVAAIAPRGAVDSHLGVRSIPLAWYHAGS